MVELKEQATNGVLKYRGIQSKNELLENLDFNCIPHNVFELDFEAYPNFLEERRKMMARKIRDYYYTL